MGEVDTQAGASAVLVTSPGVTAADGDPGDPSTVVGVTYSFDAETWLERWGMDRERAVAVSVGETTRSAAVATSTESTPAGATVDGRSTGVSTQVDAGVVETVPSERAVGEVGATVHAYLDEWAAHGPTVYVDALEDVVDATDAEVAFRFLHVLVARATETGGRVVVSLDADAVPDHVPETFAPLFGTRV